MAARPATDPWALPQAWMVRQLRAMGITDARVLDAMRTVPRHGFVPEDVQDLAYADRALPIGFEQTISQPYVVARMAELLELHPEAHVLDIGTGSGYAAAIYAQLAARVISIERIPALSARARAICTALGYANIRFLVGEGAHGYPPEAPYPAISVAAASADVPAALLAQLGDGGRLLIPLGSPSRQILMRYTRHGARVERATIAEVSFVPLVRDEENARG